MTKQKLIGSAAALFVLAIVIRSISALGPDGFSGGVSIGLLMVSAVAIIVAFSSSFHSEHNDG